MVQVLYRILLLVALVSFLAVIFALLPAAIPLPEVIVTLIEWAFGSLYFFNDILDVPTFLTGILYTLNGLIWAGGLYVGIIVIKWVTQTSS